MRLALAFLATIAACTQFPELDGTVAPEIANGSPPQLVPLSQIIERANVTTETARTAAEDIAPRVTNLRARAARLRGPVIDQATRARMLRGVR